VQAALNAISRSPTVQAALDAISQSPAVQATLNAISQRLASIPKSRSNSLSLTHVAQPLVTQRIRDQEVVQGILAFEASEQNRATLLAAEGISYGRKPTRSLPAWTVAAAHPSGTAIGLVYVSRGLSVQTDLIGRPHVLVADSPEVLCFDWLRAFDRNTVCVLMGPGNEISDGHTGKDSTAELIALREYLRGITDAPMLLSVAAGWIGESTTGWINSFRADGLTKWDGFAIEGLSGLGRLRSTSRGEVAASLGLPSNAAMVIHNWYDDSTLRASPARAAAIWQGNAGLITQVRADGWRGLWLVPRDAAEDTHVLKWFAP
jgi:hypothetical protein